MEYILETKNLSKKFKSQYAVKDVNLSIRKNKIFGLLGPNGAGKSTTLKMLCGLLKPSRGEIYFNNSLWTRENLKDIGALIEGPAVYPNLNAKDNLLLACTLYDLPKSRADEVLEIIDLKEAGKKKVKNFSLGMKQRLGLGMAIIHRPKLLILDEPTNGLDPIGINELRSLIKSFPDKGMTVILSSHILSEVEQIADEIAIIYKGEIDYIGAIKETENLEQKFIEVIEKNGGGHNA
ncbi:MAG: lantibiotic protection ABC transporter ATP-binding protein [Tissierellia bacterium]|nr:lantibiotic protection ABC transporter ATP-binding protein [Tissierellia bacterium]